jgi:hypothetical protein
MQTRTRRLVFGIYGTAEAVPFQNPLKAEFLARIRCKENSAAIHFQNFLKAEFRHLHYGTNAKGQDISLGLLKTLGLNLKPA